MPYTESDSRITGPLQDEAEKVTYRKMITRKQLVVMFTLGGLNIALALTLVTLLLLPANLPILPGGYVSDVIVIAGLFVIILMQLIVVVRTTTLSYFAARARDPIPTQPQAGLKVAVLTTVVPSKEPIELVMTTLRAMKKIRHNGTMDVWLLDEGDNPEVRKRCEEIGVRHFSRKGISEWNTPSGEFKAKTKHGNHNAWRAAHDADYDVVAQMDPDHVPFPTFLERSLGYFSDPDLAFVVAPQVYGNMTDSFVARGASEVAYIFHGVTQRGGNGHSAPLLIGTNHLYRPSAFRQIGGYQDSIIEDHLTTLVIYTAVNPDTNNQWKGVYTPDILAVGKAPVTYADYFSQQKRWAFGIWQIIREHSRKRLPKIRTDQRWAFVSLQSHYPMNAMVWIGSAFLSSIYLAGGLSVTHLPLESWAIVLAANAVVGFTFSQFMRRFNLAEHERKSWGFTGMALDLITGPIYVTSAVAQLAGRKLVYVVTAKGDAFTRDGLKTFRAHVGWAAFACGIVLAGIGQHHSYPTFYGWAALMFLISISPVIATAVTKMRVALRRVRNAIPAILTRPKIEPIEGLALAGATTSRDSVARTPSSFGRSLER